MVLLVNRTVSDVELEVDVAGHDRDLWGNERETREGCMVSDEENLEQMGLHAVLGTDKDFVEPDGSDGMGFAVSEDDCAVVGDPFLQLVC